MPLWMQSLQTPFDDNQMVGEAIGPRPLVTVRAHRPVQRTGSACSISSNSSETPVVPPTNNYNYQESRYKTELCRHWEETGTCPHGLQCLFAHGLFELRPFRGRHKKFKTQMCKAFHSTGFCSFGNRCSYIHEGRDVIPLLVQKFGFQVLHCLPADNESLLQFVLSRPELLSSDANKSPVSATRVQTIAAPQTGVQSQTRLSVFSKLCSH